MRTGRTIGSWRNRCRLSTHHLEMHSAELNNKQAGKSSPLLFGIVCLLLLILAYLSHLDFLPLNFRDDEARRALVSGEMIFSGDYLTPTINGEIYLNKPPLYNWLVTAYFKLFGNYSMFVFRLPVIVATTGMGITVYYFTRKYLSGTVAFFTAFAFMTNGRILIFDSFVGLIDTSFAWLVYINFMLIYLYGGKKKYTHLFLLTYGIVAVAFLMKGLPALVFQALSLLTYFTWKKKFSVLFHPAHFAGIGLLTVLVGAYYMAYLRVNDIALVDILARLMQESSKRTFFEHGAWRSLFNLVMFPFRFLYDFAPWTLFLLAFFQKGLWKKLRQHDFVFYSFLVGMVNIVIYWTSPEVFPRYLFMFLPLLFSVCFYLFFEVLDSNSWQHRVVRIVFLVTTALILLVLLIFPFSGIQAVTPRPELKSFLLAFLLALVLAAMFVKRETIYYYFILVVILFRFGFNWFIMEPRYKKLAASESVAAEIARLTAGHDLFILRDAQVGNFDAKSFQIMIRRKEVLRYADSIRANTFYIIDEQQAAGRNFEVLMGFRNVYADSLLLVKLPQD